jgi:hypothetical protein
VEEGPSARRAVGEEVTRGAMGKAGPRVGRVAQLHFPPYYASPMLGDVLKHRPFLLEPASFHHLGGGETVSLRVPEEYSRATGNSDGIGLCALIFHHAPPVQGFRSQRHDGCQEQCRQSTRIARRRSC